MKIILSIIALIVFSSLTIAQVNNQSQTNLKFKISTSPQSANPLTGINPLLLAVNVDKNGLITLNTLKSGTLGNSASLIDKLKDVIKQRKDAGIFREGTKEIETSAVLIVNSANGSQDIANLINKLEEAGIDPLMLWTGKTAIPVTFSNPAAEGNAVIIEISEKGEYFIGSQKTDRTLLKQVIAKNRESGENDYSILFKTSVNTPFGSIQDVLNEF